MTDPDLRSLSDQQLYERFVELTIKLGEIQYGPLRIYKRHFAERQRVTAEIKSRRVDTTPLFRPGLSHPDPWVRTSVAQHCIEGARDETLAVLKEVAALEHHPARVNASTSFDYYTTGDIIGEEAREFGRAIRARMEAARRRQQGE